MIRREFITPSTAIYWQPQYIRLLRALLALSRTGPSARPGGTERRYFATMRRGVDGAAGEIENVTQAFQTGKLRPQDKKKERSGLQSACDELTDKGAFITGE